MYPGLDPQDQLGEVLRRQEETRTRVRREAEARRVERSPRRRSPVAFKFWRLHVMVWLDDARRA